MSRDGMSILLNDGQEVHAFAFSKSWLAELGGDKARLAAMQGIQASIDHDVDGQAARKLEWSWMDTVLLCPFLVSAILIALGFNE
jgi:hypothetical protein